MRDWIIGILVSLLGVLLIGFAHLEMDKNNMLTTFNSFNNEAKPLEVNYSYLTEVYLFHKTEPTFKRRVVTTSSIIVLKKITAWSEGTCFIIVQFFAFFFCGFFLFFISKELGHSVPQRILSCLIFYLSYSVLMAFFITNYTYDEPLQYLFLFASIFALRHKKQLLFFVAFLLALLTKETSALFIGFLAWHHYKSHRKFVFSSIFAFGIFIIFQLLFFKESNMLSTQASRLELYNFNFETAEMSLESIVSFLIVAILGVILSIGSKGIFKWRSSFLIILVLNTAAIFYLAYARESRLFALPLILFWPFSGLLLQHAMQDLLKTIKCWQLIQVVPLIICIVGFYFSYSYLHANYKTSITLLNHTVNWQYLMVLMPVTFILIYIKLAGITSKFLNR